MRMIDPFVAPGLWGGAPMPPRFGKMTAVRSPKHTAVINHVLSQAFTHAPLASLAGSALATRFHAWHGRSRRRAICSVFPVVESNGNKGLPEFDGAIVIAAGREQGRLHALAVFALNESEDRALHVAKAIAAGAVEWHVHLPSGSADERMALLRDLESV